MGRWCRCRQSRARNQQLGPEINNLGQVGTLEIKLVIVSRICQALHSCRVVEICGERVRNTIDHLQETLVHQCWAVSFQIVGRLRFDEQIVRSIIAMRKFCRVRAPP